MTRFPAIVATAASALGLSLLAAPPTTAAPVGQAAPAAERYSPSDRKILYRQFDGGRELRQGRFGKTRVMKGQIALGAGNKAPTGKRRFGGRLYEQGFWDSPWIEPGFGATELIPSWSAKTPRGTWVEIRVRGKAPNGQRSSWDVLGRWASYDKGFKRRTKTGQTDDLARVAADTVRTASADGFTSYQMRVLLLRRKGQRVTPKVDVAGIVGSRVPAGGITTSRPSAARGTVLNVPSYSQMIHSGHYPQYGNGGQAWCSPTATSMVLGYYGALPSPRAYSWVAGGHEHPWVDHAARMVYDYDYDGAGNWAFNTAYAAPLAGKAFITRMRSLRDAEKLIAAGIPVIASLSWGSGQLSNAAVGSSNGHLMVIVGFTASGDVVTNDPAGRSNSQVRRVYDRGQFERQWLTTSSQGTAYVIRTKARKLPASSGLW